MLVDDLDTLFGRVSTLQKIEEGVSVDIFADELFEQDGSLKFARPSIEWPHREAFHIFLRSLPKSEFEKGRSPGNITTTVDTQRYADFPKLKAWIEAFAQRHNGSVERVIIAALGARKQIYRHADRGLYFAPRDRYHLVLKSDGGAMRIAGKEGLLRQGEVWWINNKAGHESFNDSDNPRIHLIVDILPNSLLKRVKNYLRWFYLGLRPKRLTNYYFNWPKRHNATS